MRLTQNPILHTHFTLAKRRGLHFVFIAVALGAAVMAWAYLGNLSDALDYAERHGRNIESVAARMGVDVYLATLMAQAFAVLAGGVIAVAAIARDRRSKVLEANRLTPMTPADLAIGYWFGPLVPTLALCGIGTAYAVFIAVVTPAFSIGLVLQTQLLVYSGALMFALGASLVGLSVRNTAAGVFVLGAMAVAAGYGALGAELALPNYLSGLAAMSLQLDPPHVTVLGWQDASRVFGFQVPSLMLTLAIQGVAVAFLWTGLTRKLRDARLRAFPRSFLLAAFAAGSLAQVALVWEWAYANPHTDPWDQSTVQAFITLVGLAVALLVSLASALSPDEIRRRVIRGEALSAWRLSSATVGVACALAVAAAFAALPPSIHAEQWAGWLDLTVSIVLVAFATEIARLSHNPRAGTFAGLAVSALFFFPLALALLAQDGDIVGATFGVSGACMLLEDGNEWSFAALVAHTIIVVVLVPIWASTVRDHVDRTRAASTLG